MIKQSSITALAFILLLGIFLIDLLTPKGYTVFIFYFIPVLLASQGMQYPLPFIFPAMSTLFIILGYLLSPSGGDPARALVNRSLDIFMLWILSFYLVRYRQVERRAGEAEKELRKSYEGLERRVEERTGELAQTNALLQVEIAERRLAENALQTTHENISEYVRELEQRNREVEMLNEMVSLLQASTTFEEASSIVEKSIPKIFPSESGALYLLSTSRNILKAAVLWGGITPEEQVLAPEECWALRLGRIHQVDTSRPEVICPHVKHVPHGICLCVPMMAQNETTGLLHLCVDSTDQRLVEHKQRIAVAVAESIALLLSNLRLRETLYTQSIHDPLTGLLNRRYMEELVEKELHRLSRRGLPLGIVMIDIDHFKEINDTYGHEAGDMFLRELGAFLQKNIREEDFACRYGGEEFVIIMPEIPLEHAHQRAEQLRQAVKHLFIRYKDRSLGPVTISLGVAARPEHGTSAHELFAAADSALYRAKEEGRDRVAVEYSPG